MSIFRPNAYRMRSRVHGVSGQRRSTTNPPWGPHVWHVRSAALAVVASLGLAGAVALPAGASIDTASHRPAYSSGAATSAGHRAAMDALGERFPEYVLNLNGHVHTNEVFAPQNGVIHVTAGAGGEGLERLPGPAAGSTFRLQHSGFAVLDVNPDAISVDDTLGPRQHDLGPARPRHRLTVVLISIARSTAGVSSGRPGRQRRAP